MYFSVVSLRYNVIYIKRINFNIVGLCAPYQSVIAIAPFVFVSRTLPQAASTTCRVFCPAVARTLVKSVGHRVFSVREPVKINKCFFLTTVIVIIVVVVRTGFVQYLFL